MGTGAKIAAAVAAGYLLGRTKKLKLAIAAGGLLAGRKLSTDPRELVKQGMQYLQSSPELARLTEQLRGSLLDAARSAAVSTASSRIDSLSEALHERSERWRGTAAGEQAQPEEAAAEEPEEPEEEEPEEEEPEEEEPEEEEPEEEEPEEEEAERGGRAIPEQRGEQEPAKKPAKKTAKKTAKKSTRQASGSGRAAKKSSSGRGQSSQRRG